LVAIYHTMHVGCPRKCLARWSPAHLGRWSGWNPRTCPFPCYYVISGHSMSNGTNICVENGALSSCLSRSLKVNGPETDYNCPIF